MKYVKFPASAPLRPFIECYYVWEGFAPERIEVQSPPSACGALVINYGDTAWARQDRGELQFVPDAFVCGLFTSRLYRVLEGKIGMAGIVFKPSAVHNFFGVKMSQLVNNRMPLELLLGGAANTFAENVRKASTDEARAKALEDFALPYVEHAQKSLNIIDDTIDYIDGQHGNVTVADVAGHFRISRRYLEKQFLEKVGVSPKFYSRICRFSILANKIVHAEKVDWQSIVHESGFHDQSHFFKDFIEFNGVSPTEYLENHQELIRFLRS